MDIIQISLISFVCLAIILVKLVQMPQNVRHVITIPPILIEMVLRILLPNYVIVLKISLTTGLIKSVLSVLINVEVVLIPLHVQHVILQIIDTKVEQRVYVILATMMILQTLLVYLATIPAKHVLLVYLA